MPEGGPEHSRKAVVCGGDGRADPNSGGQDFQRDLASQLSVPRAAHVTHAASSERPVISYRTESRPARRGINSPITPKRRLKNNFKDLVEWCNSIAAVVCRR